MRPTISIHCTQVPTRGERHVPGCVPVSRSLAVFLLRAFHTRARQFRMNLEWRYSLERFNRLPVAREWPRLRFSRKKLGGEIESSRLYLETSRKMAFYLWYYIFDFTYKIKRQVCIQWTGQVRVVGNSISSVVLFSQHKGSSCSCLSVYYIFDSTHKLGGKRDAFKALVRETRFCIARDRRRGFLPFKGQSNL